MPRGRAWSGRVALCLALLMAAQAQAQAKEGAKRPAAVDDQEARDLFRLGKQAFDEARYERALKYFKDAYELSGRAQLQFNIGTVLDRLRRDREAIDAYRSYLAQTPDATNRSAVEERIRLLQDALGTSEPAAVPALQPSMPEPAAAHTAAPPVVRSGPQLPAPTPAETARAGVQVEQSGVVEPQPTAAGATSESSPAITSRWWFWTGIGAGVVGAAVLVVALRASSGDRTVEAPAVLGTSTRVRPL